MTSLLLKSGEFFEKYQILKTLGHGGMGAVYLGRHQVLDTLFAIKVLHSNVSAKSKEFAERFIREGKLASRVRHQNLVQVYDAGYNSEKEVHYLVMDYIAGGSGRDLLKREKKLPKEIAVTIIYNVALALVKAEEFHLVHRDIKPDNIMFTESGVAKLADLGIAKSNHEQDVTLTKEASVLGTPAYMPPEQAMDSSKVDQRADIYSLGVVFYEFLTGERPYKGKNHVEILTKVLSEAESPDPRSVNEELPADLADIVNSMIQKDMNNRISSASELVELLRGLECFTPQMDKTVFSKMVTPETVNPLQAIELTLPTVDIDRTLPTMVTAVDKTDVKIESPKPHKSKSLILSLVGLVIFILLTATALPLLSRKEKLVNEQEKIIALEENSLAETVKEIPSQEITHSDNKETHTSEEKIIDTEYDSSISASTETQKNVEVVFKDKIVIIGEKVSLNPMPKVTVVKFEGSLGLRKQIEQIVTDKPKLVIFNFVKSCKDEYLSISSFENIMLELTVTLKENRVDFHFLTTSLESTRQIERYKPYNDVVRRVCDLRSYGYTDIQKKIIAGVDKKQINRELSSILLF